jgi:hypothetical protein
LGVDAEGLAVADLSSLAGAATSAAGGVGGDSFEFVAVLVADRGALATVVTTADLFRA